MPDDHFENHGFLRHARNVVRVALLGAIAAMASFAPAHADGPAPHEHTALHEIDFLQHGIDHHQVALRMSDLCAQRATDAEVLNLCGTMAEAHRNDRDQLQSWLQAWYDDDHEPAIPDALRARLAQLETLTDAEFEQAFLKDMIGHHVVAIEHGAMCEAQFYHEELTGYCQTAIATSADEIMVMRNELCETHGICDLKLTANPVLDQPTEPFDIDADGGGEGDADADDGGEGEGEGDGDGGGNDGG